jgi:hypothetical protein
MRYLYSILKFVPDPARGETVNLGALAGSDETGDWELRTISNFSRARAIDDEGALGSALTFVEDIEDRIGALQRLPGFSGEQISVAVVERWAQEMNNVVQFSEPLPLLADSAAEALDVVFEELVVDPARREFPFLKKHPAVSRTAGAYREARIPDEAIAKHLDVGAGPFRGSFDFGLHNGQLVQLVKCWSFQLPGQDELAEEVKAWAWLVERLRETGGEGSSETRTYPIGGEADVAVVYVPPIGNRPSSAFDEASAAFISLNVRAVEMSSAGEVAREGARRLAEGAHR